MINSASIRKLSRRRHSSKASDVPAFVAEQLRHFGIDVASEFGRALAAIATKLYAAQDDLDALWRATMGSAARLRPQIDALIRECYFDTHHRYAESNPAFAAD